MSQALVYIFPVLAIICALEEPVFLGFYLFPSARCVLHRVDDSVRDHVFSFELEGFSH